MNDGAPRGRQTETWPEGQLGGNIGLPSRRTAGSQSNAGNSPARPHMEQFVIDPPYAVFRRNGEPIDLNWHNSRRAQA
jgi:hypothetical protein